MTAVEKLQAFLREERINIIPVPQFIARDDGTFSIIVQLSIQEQAEDDRTRDTIAELG